ncbi:MAG: heparin/heparin-sulfate lyase HepB [Candidatus Cryptobacteroides sp.]
MALAASLLFLPLSAVEPAQRDSVKAVWTEVDGVNIPLPPIEHPRLYVRTSDIPALKEKMKSPQGKKILGKLRELSIPRTEEEEAEVKLRDFRYYFQMRGVTSEVQLQALDYLVDGDKNKARKAITSMLDTLKRVNFDTGNDRTRASGVMIMVGSMVYDWCYDQMTPQERQEYISEFKRIAGTMECHYPPKNTEPVAGHCSEWNILRDLLSAGVAVYDEDPEIYNYVATMLFRDYVPVRDYTYKGGNYHQGSGYVSVRYINDLISLWIFDRMGAGAVYAPEQQYVLYDFIYRRRPDGGVLPAGDVNPGNRKSPNSYAMPAMFAAGYYHDPYIQNEYFIKPSVEAHLLMMQLLWMDFDLKPKTPEDLPLTRYCGTPFGWMIARTGWDKNSVIAEMKVNEHFYGNHQHLDGGSFQIYYKGPLAIDSGSYQGSSGGYNSPHNKNYFKRTIAHNSLLVYDPDEVFECWNYGGGDKTKTAANDGGQRMPGDRWETCRSYEQLLSDDYTVGEALAHGFGPDPTVPEYSYLKGDITKAYTSKVKDVRRSFVFLNLNDGTVPAAMVIYDNVVSSNPSFRKYWLMHSIEQPVVSGNEFTISRTLNGDSGMLKNTVLLPRKASVKAVGGEGKEFWVFGTNYPNAATSRPDPANERGAWRVEVCPSKASVSDNFLNVIQVADNDCKNFGAVAMVESATVAGAVVADRVVTFSRDSKALDACSFEVKADKKSGKAGSYKILVTDLKPGRWTVKSSGRTLGVFEVAPESGTLYFDAPAGLFELALE